MNDATTRQTAMIFKMMSAHIDLIMETDPDPKLVPTVDTMRKWAIINLPGGTKVRAIENALDRLHSTYWLKSK